VTESDSGGLLIRHACEPDLEALNDVYNHWVASSHVTFDIEKITPAQRLEWYREFSHRGPYQLFIALRDGGFLGFAHSKSLRPKQAYLPSVETTVYLHPEARGAGVGGSLYRALFDALLEEDVHRAYGAIALPNPDSIRLHRRLGFHEIGTYDEVGRKFGRYWSVRWFEKALR
jgi:phosphinothricin acetyltransferase